MSATAGTGIRATLRRSWPVLVSYGLFSIWGVGCLVVSLMLTSGGFGVSPGDVAALFGVLIATVVGHIGGNVLGLAGLRLAPVLGLFTILFIIASLSGVAIGPIALYLIVALFAAIGGYLGVASRLDVVAAWYPLSFAIGGAIHWMNHHGAIETFNGGSKHSLWDPFTMVCLTGAVFLMLVFLATRNSLGLTVWQEVARPHNANAADDERDHVAVARPGRGSFVVLFLFTLVVLGSTALISPYLFRTRDTDGKDGNGGDKSSQQGDKDGKDGKDKDGKDGKDQDGKDGKGKHTKAGKSGKAGKGKAGKDGKQGSGDGDTGEDGDQGGDDQGDGNKSAEQDQGTSSSGHSPLGPNKGGKQTKKGKQSKTGGHSSSGSGAGSGDGEDSSGDDEGPVGDPDTDHAGEAASEAANLGLKIFGWLLVAAIALLILMLVIFPPIRRAFLMRHLKKPLWPVAPTSRVMNSWRRALAILAVIEIEPQPGETPTDFAKRAETELMSTLGCDANDLKVAAAIVEKIHYAGRGLGAGEEQIMRDAIDRFVGNVNPRIGFKRKFTASWGQAPEVES